MMHLSVLSLLTFSVYFSKATPIWKRVDYNPVITGPPTGTVFYSGSEGYISWNATEPIGYDENYAKTANVVLGYKLANTTSLHLEITLLTNVSLYSPPNQAKFTLPDGLIERDAYILALIGSSGDNSDEFTIRPASEIPSPPAMGNSDPFMNSTSTQSGLGKVGAGLAPGEESTGEEESTSEERIQLFQSLELNYENTRGAGG